MLVGSGWRYTSTLANQVPSELGSGSQSDSKSLPAPRDQEIRHTSPEALRNTCNPAYHQLIGHRSVVGLEMLRAARPALKVLFVSDYSETAIFRGELLEAQMDMLTKPFALDTLGAKVHAVINR